MAEARDYQSMKALCEDRAARSSSDETRRAWLNLADTYETLSMFDKINFHPVQIGKGLERR
jgi:hypothetical protein